MHRPHARFALPLALFAVTLLGASPPPGGASAPSPAMPAPEAPATPDVPLTPEGIYLRAVKAMKAEPLPAFVVFDEDFQGRNVRLECTPDGTALNIKHGDIAGGYHVWYRVSDQRSVAQDRSNAKGCTGSFLLPTSPQILALGASTPAPAPAVSAAALPTAAPDPSGAMAPALIGAVRVESAKYYHIELADRENFEGHDVYRLTLRAYRDPLQHPLTELLVDTGSFLVRRATGEGAVHLVIASGRVAGTVVFDREGPYWVVRDEDFELAFTALFVHGRSHLTVRGSDYAYADALPGIAFPTPVPVPSAKAAK